MAREHLHHLPVVEAAGSSVSSAPRTSLPGRAATSRTWARIRIARVMHRDPISLSRKATLDDAAVLLAGGRYHSLPVTDADGTVVGVVTSTDLIVVLLHQLPASERAGAACHRVPPAAADEFAGSGGAGRLSQRSGAAPAVRGRGGPAGACPRSTWPARSRELENVRRAADVYLRSGQGEHEHTALVRALEQAREHLGPGLTTGRL